VPSMLMPNTTHPMAMAIGHSSAAYSLEVVMPIGRERAAARMINCQPQKWMLLSASLNMRVFSRRCIETRDTRENAVAHKGEDHRIGMQRPQPAKPEIGNAEIGLGQIKLEGQDQPDQHAHQPEHNGRYDKLANDVVIILKVLYRHRKIV